MSDEEIGIAHAMAALMRRHGITGLSVARPGTRSGEYAVSLTVTVAGREPATHTGKGSMLEIALLHALGLVAAEARRLRSQDDTRPSLVSTIRATFEARDVAAVYSDTDSVSRCTCPGFDTRCPVHDPF